VRSGGGVQQAALAGSTGMRVGAGAGAGAAVISSSARLIDKKRMMIGGTRQQCYLVEVTAI
jgi:hypothetical protein